MSYDEFRSLVVESLEDRIACLEWRLAKLREAYAEVMAKPSALPSSVPEVASPVRVLHWTQRPENAGKLKAAHRKGKATRRRA